MVDTKSLMQVLACCTMFKICAMDSLCYSHIDLTTGNVGSRVVRSMILNAGKELRDVDSLDRVLDLLTRKCQHLFLEKQIGYGRWSYVCVSAFETNCPNITSLSLIDYYLSDRKAYLLIKCLRKLKYLKLSRTFKIKGGFLRDVSHDCKDSLLETLILRDCSLKGRNVCRFLDSLLIGHFRFIRHIDVSNNIGLLYGGRRFSKPEFPLEELNEERPGLTFVADFESPPSSSSSSSSSAAAAESDFRSSSSSSSSSSYSSSSSSGDSSSGSGTEDDDD